MAFCRSHPHARRAWPQRLGEWSRSGPIAERPRAAVPVRPESFSAPARMASGWACHQAGFEPSWAVADHRLVVVAAVPVLPAVSFAMSFEVRLSEGLALVRLPGSRPAPVHPPRPEPP